MHDHRNARKTVYLAIVLAISLALLIADQQGLFSPVSLKQPDVTPPASRADVANQDTDTPYLDSHDDETKGQLRRIPLTNQKSIQATPDEIEHWNRLSAFTTNEYREDIISNVFYKLDATEASRIRTMADAGDRDAAYVLYMRYRMCSNTPTSEAELNRRLELYTQDGSEFPNLDGSDINLFDFMVAEFSNCASFGDNIDFAELAFYWHTRAGQLGHLAAQIDYPQMARDNRLIDRSLKHPELMQTYQDNARQFMQDALRSGNAGAFLSIAREYREGILLDRNDVLAYAYAWAARQAGHRTSQSVDHLVDQYHADLNDTQRADAKAIGNRLCREYCRSDD